MNIRSALPEDTNRLASLSAKLNDLHTDAHPADFKKVSNSEAQDYLAKKLSSEMAICLVAVDDGKVLGYLLGEVIERRDDSFMHDRNIFYGHHLIVEPSMRGRHLSKRLMSSAEIAAKERGCTIAVLDVWAFNERTIRLYEHLGFVKASYQMTKELG